MQRPADLRFVILGGSFNPVHTGHVGLAGTLAALPGVSRVLVIPAARNPLKREDRLLPADLRLEMARAGFAALPNVTVLDLELRRPPPSYTFDTVTELRAQHPGALFDIALGWDAFRDIAAWHRAEELLEIAGLIVVPRADPPHGMDSARASPGATVPGCLPERWRGRLTETVAGQWRDDAGRTVVRTLALRIPDVSATRIWDEQRWDLVPESARALLLRHLKQAGRLGETKGPPGHEPA